ncbi:MAG: Ig-like domain-containing protein [Acidobacteriota bacterium]
MMMTTVVLSTLLLLPDAALSPVTFRFVEVNTAACDWDGAPTFTCRELATPLTLEVRFEPAAGRQLVIDMDGTQVAVLAEPGSHLFADDAALARGPHRLNLILMEQESAVWRKSFRFDVVAHRDPGAAPPPFVTFVTPKANERVAGAVTIDVRAHNPQAERREVDRIDFSVDGRPLESLSKGPWKVTWDASAETPGEHVVTAQAFGPGGTSAAEVTVHVLGQRTLLAARNVEVVPGSPYKASIAFPEHAIKMKLDARLLVGMDGNGRVIGRFLDETGSTVAVLLDMASQVSPAIPFTRDLSIYAGHTLTLELVAEGGGKLVMSDLIVTAYEE